MLIERGIDLTLGPADIRRCHWIYDVLDELKMRNKDFIVLKDNFRKDDFRDKVIVRLIK